MAWLCRVGHQPISEVLALELDDAWQLAEALGRLVERENESGAGAES